VIAVANLVFELEEELLVDEADVEWISSSPESVVP
jgi:hypothetical protein